MRLALAPFYCGLPLRHILVARAPGTDSSQLPPVLSTEQLLAHTATDQLADLVRKTLIENPVSISEKIPKGAATFLKEALISNASMPRPQKLARACFPNSQPFPASLDDRFLGRANDLFNIDQALANVGTGAATIAGQVSAAGGFGKTRLAIEYARRYANRRFPGGVFWLDASQNNLEEQFHVMWREIDANASELKIMREESRPVGPELARALKKIGQGVLFVIDNLPESSPPPALATYCPALDHVTVLATSRQDTGDPSVREIKIGALPRLASVLLLIHGLPNPGVLTLLEWESIAEAVGDLPLALDLLNAVLRHDLSPVQLRDRLAKATGIEELDARAEALKSFVAPGALRGITETFAISFERLTPPAQQAAAILAQLLPGTPIPEPILEALPSELNTSAIRIELRARNFVQLVEGENVFGTIHRLIGAYLRKVANPGSRMVATRAVHEVMAADLCRTPSSWPLMTQCEPHAFEVLSHNRDLDTALVDERYAEVCVSLGHSVGILAFEQGDYPAALSIRRITYHHLTKFLHRDHDETITALGNLAESCRQAGDLDQARVIQEQVLICRQKGGDELPETLAAMNNLAATKYHQGYLSGARELYEHVLSVRERVLESENPDLLTSMGNLGELKWRLKDYVGARALQEPVLAGWRRRNEPIQTATALLNLSMTSWLQKNLSEARELMREAEELFRLNLGEAHPKSVHASKCRREMIQDEIR